MGVFIAIVFLLAEIGILILLLYKIKRYKNLTIKDTIVYPLLIIITFLLMLFSRLVVLEIPFWTNVKDSFNDAIDIAKLTLNQDMLKVFKENDFALLIPYYGAFTISLTALASLTVYLLNITARNFNRLIIARFNGKHIILLFGYNDDLKKMVKHFKDEKVKMIAVLDSGSLNKYVEEKTYLDKHHISYLEYPYKEKEDYVKTIRKITRLKRKHYTIITFFQDDKKNDEFSNAALTYLKSAELNRGNTDFIMNVNNVQDEFIQNRIYDPISQKDTTEGKLRTYNKYDLNSYLFLKEHPLPKYIHSLENKGEKFINDDCTLSNADIHLYFIGFGKVNQPLLRDVLITNQFVEKEEVEKGQYLLKKKPLDVDVYEIEKKLNAVELTTGLLKYRKSDYNKKDYLNLCDDYVSNIKFHLDTNIEDSGFINRVYDDIKNRIRENKKKQINFFFVSLKSDMYNTIIVNKIKKHIDAINDSYSFYFVRKESVMVEDNKGDNLIYICQDDTIFSSKNVLLNEVYNSAKYEHLCYIGKKDEKDVDKYWNELTKTKQKSNLYAISGICFKKELLNCDINNYKEKYNPHNVSKVSDDDIKRLITPHKEYDPIDVLAFLEHERWNAFELSQGVLPMKKEIFLEMNKGKKDISNKSEDGNYHLCIASQKGLVEYYELFKKHNFDGANVIGYDYDSMDNFITHYHLLNEVKK